MRGLQRLIKQTLAATLFYSGAIQLWLWLKAQRHGRAHCLILAYHCFLESGDPLRRFIQDGLCVTPGNFDRQLLFFKRHYHLMSLDEVVNHLEANKPLPPRTLVLTVDDGWRDNHDHALPLLLKHRAPATIFLAVDYIDNRREFWFLTVGRLLDGGKLPAEQVAGVLADALRVPPAEMRRLVSAADGTIDRDRLMEQLKLLDYEKQETTLAKLGSGAVTPQGTDSADRCTLNWDEVRKMHRAGICFGSHGLTHRIMTLLPNGEARAELQNSRERIGKELETIVRHFSYPNGNYNASLMEMVRQAGYACALATGGGVRPGSGPMDRFALRRLGMHDGVATGVGGKFSPALLAFHLARFG